MRVIRLGSAIAAPFALALLLSGVAFASSQHEAGQSAPLVLRVREAGVRNEPGESAETAGRVVFREVLAVLDRREDWLRVRSESTGVTGWVHRYATFPRVQQRSLAGLPVPTGVVLITDIRDYQGGAAEYAFTPSGWVYVASVAGDAARVAAIDVAETLQPTLVIMPGQAVVFGDRVRLPAGPFRIMVFRAQGPTGRFQEAMIRNPRKGVLYHLGNTGALLALPD